MRRRFVLSLAVFLCVAVATFVTLWFAIPPTHRINDENIRKIKNGMTLKQVETILGAPAGDYSTRKVVFDYIRAEHFPANGEIWTSNEAQVWIFFDRNGCVHYVVYFSRTSIESLWDLLCRRMQF